MNTTSYEFRAKCIALILACLLHILILILLYVYTRSHIITTQRTPKTPLRVSLKQSPSLPTSVPSVPPIPLVKPEPVAPEPTTIEPTQSITHSVAHTAPELPLFIPSDIHPDIQQDASLDTTLDTTDTTVPLASESTPDTTSFDQNTNDNHDHAAEKTVAGIPSDTTQNLQDTQATAHEIAQTSPVSTPLHTTQVHPHYSSPDTTSAQHQNRARQPRRKKRYVNKRLLAATQAPETQELMQACKTALKSVVHNTDTRAYTTPRDYKKLAHQAAQAGISVEHMAHVQDNLAHMKYAHYENKARELLRQTCNIHTVNVTVTKPILEYIDIFITVDKQGNVLQVKFCSPLLLDIEQAITQLIKLCQFPPLPDHFKSPEHTFGLRALVDFQQGKHRVICS